MRYFHTGRKGGKEVCEKKARTTSVPSFHVVFRQFLEQKCVVIDFYSHPSPTSKGGNGKGDDQ